MPFGGLACKLLANVGSSGTGHKELKYPRTQELRRELEDGYAVVIRN
jgi:hypothetical protein